MKNKKTKIKISVIVCTYNRSKKIENCLKALLRQSLDKDEYEIIVVNDGSTDNTEKILKKYSVKTITNITNKGLAESRNIGTLKSTAKILAFTDDDCVPDKHWLKNILSAYTDRKIIAVGGKIVPLRLNHLLLKYYSLYNPLAHLASDSYKLSYPLYNLFQYFKRTFYLHELLDTQNHLYLIIGANMSMRRSTYNLVGGFDKDLKFGGEEEDFWIKVNKLMPKAILKYAPNALIKHDYEPSFIKALKQNYRYGTGGAKLYIKSKERTPTIYPFPIIILFFLILALLNNFS